MLKKILKRVSVLFVAILFLSNFGLNTAFAFTVYEASGPAYVSGPIYVSSANVYRTYLKGSMIVRYVNKVWYSDTFDGPPDSETEEIFLGADYLDNRCNGPHETFFYDVNNNLVAYLKWNGSDIVNESSDCTPSDPPPDDTGSCDNCGVFSCPGWNEYMGKLDEIKSAIPPAPNWHEVSQNFMSDLSDLLGKVPDPPIDAINPPERPQPSETLDVGGIEAPTGSEASGFEESTFDEDDIKNQAPVIEEREDPTDGFIINNPLDSLPSQEEFMQNIPTEGDNMAPIPPEQENIAPTPTEGGDNTAPIPTEEGTAPLPGDDGGTVPIPANDGSIAPIPSEDNSTAPLPGGG